MKKIACVLIAVMLVITAITLPVSAQSTENRPVSGFNRIVLGESLVVHVKIDGTESLKISGSPDVIKVIETVVEDGTLNIKFKDDLKSGEGNSDGPIDIYVTAKSLSSLVKEGSGSIDVDGALTGNDVSIILSGSGNIRSAIRSRNLKVNMSGACSASLSGTVDMAEVNTSGACEMNGRDLKTKDASVAIAGSGNVYFSADKTVSANIAGSGSVIYSGNATVTDSKIVGSGAISKAK